MSVQAPAGEAEALGGFDALLADLDVMTKALPAADDDATIQAAAKDGGVDTLPGAGEGDEGAGNEDRDPEDGDGKGEPFGKSFPVQLPDGTTADALDGTLMLKALMERMDERDTASDALMKSMETLGTTILKPLLAHVTEQGTLIKALRADVARLGNQGGGRKAVLHINDKPALGGPTQEAPPAGPTGEELMAKAMTLVSEGKIDASAANRLFTYQTRGLGVPDELRGILGA